MEEDILIHSLEDFDLTLLRVINNPTPTPETPHTKIPLPNLDTLEVYGAQKFTDEEILGVLRSRIDASKRGEVSSSSKGQIPILEAEADRFQGRSCSVCGIGWDCDGVGT
jgi:hypothetical protein